MKAFHSFLVYFAYTHFLCAQDPSECWDLLRDTSNFVETKTGFYYFSSGRTIFVPDSDKTSPRYLYSVTDPSHRAIVESIIGKEAYARLIRGADAESKILEEIKKARNSTQEEEDQPFQALSAEDILAYFQANPMSEPTAPSEMTLAQFALIYGELQDISFLSVDDLIQKLANRHGWNKETEVPPAVFKFQEVEFLVLDEKTDRSTHVELLVFDSVKIHPIESQGIHDGIFLSVAEAVGQTIDGPSKYYARMKGRESIVIGKKSGSNTVRIQYSSADELNPYQSGGLTWKFGRHALKIKIPSFRK